MEPIYTNRDLKSIKGEIWKPINGAGKYYMVSNKGRVKRLKRIAKHSQGGNREFQELILKSYPSKVGYCSVRLITDTFDQRFTVHRLVAEHFCEKKEDAPYVNHLNGIKHDNRAENLEWCTASENTIHALETGLIVRPKGEEVKWAKLTNKEVIEIYKSKEKYRVLANKFGVGETVVCSIKRGRSWRHVTGQVYSPNIVEKRVVTEIRESSLSRRKLAKYYGLSVTVVRNIILRVTHKDVI